MKIGDLIKLKKPTTTDFDEVFLVVDIMDLGKPWAKNPNDWLKLEGKECWVTSGWTWSADYQVVSMAT